MDFLYLTPKKELKISGIYLLRNSVNMKCYIGSSLDCYTRVARHKSDLIKHKHCNNHLQSAMSKYGLDKFEVSLIESCTKELLADREHHWIDALDCLDNGYNQCQVTTLRKNKVSEETRNKISKSLCKKRIVEMCDMGNVLICQFESLYMAAKYIVDTGISKGKLFTVRMKIGETIRKKKVSNGRGTSIRQSAYGFKWRAI